MKLNQLAGLRGICAWWVVFFHSLGLMSNVPAPLASFLSQGYLAVDLFFLLSGFVIFLNYHAALAKNFPRSVGKFYWNRFTRIYPLHFVMLGGYLMLFCAFYFFSKSGSAPDSYTLSSFIQSFFLIHMWVGSDLTWNVPSWSISSEWFVYLFFPLMVFLLNHYRSRIAWHLLAIALLAATLHGIYVASGVESLGAAIPRMALIRTMLEFLMGVQVGSLYVHHREFVEKYRSAALAGFLAACAAYASLDLPDHVLMPTAFSLLIFYLSVGISPVHALLSNKVLVYLGEISYSTYMVHYLVYDLLKALFMSNGNVINQLYVWLSFVVVLVLSMVLHHVIDTPSQKYFRSLAGPRKAIASTNSR